MVRSFVYCSILLNQATKRVSQKPIYTAFYWTVKEDALTGMETSKGGRFIKKKRLLLLISSHRIQHHPPFFSVSIHEKSFLPRHTTHLSFIHPLNLLTLPPQELIPPLHPHPNHAAHLHPGARHLPRCGPEPRLVRMGPSLSPPALRTWYNSGAP